ncbi:hypothetical protein [Deinococcus cellulosilyticus]|uniref:Uncharacterized protein n=1 Tax=Deinococcus cellulosilyticus (strain DSM 18568 / NBRC 106333 / KACC 11606 / 5516J-15) TaxID=1223518 RepID=A0A511N7T9_DEIC1|nr:hypothetical protein [Deinococcus cellulosilyticus]GEM48904.1 hypothetical protein DC3_45390 [Deinococcus cellulosilyticus NBRC 106333 = KACC 11606]
MQHLQEVSDFKYKYSDHIYGFCDFEVYSTPDRDQVVIYLHDPEPRALGAAHLQPHKVVNAFYREVLFRHLTPASRLSWYYVAQPEDCLPIHLEGLPGGYTDGHVDRMDQVESDLAVLLSIPASAIPVARR